MNFTHTHTHSPDQILFLTGMFIVFKTNKQQPKKPQNCKSNNSQPVGLNNPLNTYISDT